MKKDLTYDKIIETSKQISQQYDKLTEFMKIKKIAIRTSKTEPRIKVENPVVEEPVERVYKPTNEVIITKKDAPEKIQEILKPAEEPLELKQWKVKQIYEAIQANSENTYKEYCELNNDTSKNADWEKNWVEFVLSVNGKTQKDAEKTIRNFVENLRRIRHNELCYEHNSTIIDRKDREQWPATTVVRAFLDGKLDIFKEFTEKQTDDNPNDKAWQNRWLKFITSLEENREDETKLKELCSKFMTAQRTKKYRRTVKYQN